MHSLLLSIADITVVLSIQDKKEYVFLKKKYTDFAINARESSFQPTYYVDINKNESGNSAQIEHVGNTKYLLFCPSPQHYFLEFNDVFRKLFNEIIVQNSGFLLHASSLCSDSKAYIFMGHEGAGKSTVRTLCNEIECLGDDVALIRKENNHYYLYGSPFYQKTKRSYPNKKVAIAGVFELQQAPFTLIQEIAWAEQWKALLSNTFLPEKNTATVFKTLLSFMQEVCIATLRFTKARTFWELLTNTDLSFFSPVIKPAPILKKIAPPLRPLVRHLNWSKAICTFDFFEQMQVIAESSWQFEFSAARNLEAIAKMVSMTNRNGTHTTIIRELVAKPSDHTLIAIEHHDSFVLLDGNHHAISWFVDKKTNRNRTFTLLLTKTSGLISKKLRAYML